jgi:hypothetical protein
MKWIQKILINLAEWLKPEIDYIFSRELPEIVNEKTFYIIGNPSEPWLLAFKCPCGCQEIIQLNLLRDATPCWKYKLTFHKRLNISPSIWRTTGCKSHFIVHKSKIDWVKSFRTRA